MPKVQLFNTQTEQSDIKKRTYVSKETQVRFNQNSLAFKTKLFYVLRKSNIVN